MAQFVIVAEKELVPLLQENKFKTYLETVGASTQY